MSTIFQGPDRFLPTNYTPALGEFAGIQGSVSAMLPALVVSAAGTAGASQAAATPAGGWRLARTRKKPKAKPVAGVVGVTIGAVAVTASAIVDNSASIEADDEALLALWTRAA